MGIASIDSAARVCHAPSTVGLKETIGVAASTCSLQDVIESDLVVLWGTNPANNQPVFMKYLYLAKQRGCRVVVVNPYLEPGLERYWVPSNLESALFGTKVCDLHVPVRPGGDVALANAALKRLIERGAVDDAFIAAHTTGWDELVAALDGQPEAELLEAGGVTADQLDAFVDLYAGAASAVLVWSMGITQHRDAVDGVRAIVNLGLARGNVGRDGAGLMPIRGHSGVQGGAEMGAYATALPGGAPVDPEHAAGARGRSGASRCPTRPAAPRPRWWAPRPAGELDVLWTSGGNFLEVLPDPPSVAAALDRVPLRVHQDVVVTTQMLAEGDDVLLLPVATRYEQEGGGTSTTTERRIIFSPEIPRQVGEARSEWRLFAEVASRVRPEHADAFRWATNQDLRGEIARGRARLRRASRRWPRPATRCSGAAGTSASAAQFPLPDGRGRFTALEPAASTCPTAPSPSRPGAASSSTRWCTPTVDPLTGAGRDAVYIDEADARRLGRRRRHAGAAPQRGRHLRRPPQGRSPAGPLAPGPLARGQRAHLRWRGPPRAPLEGARTTTRSSPSRCWPPRPTVSLAHARTARAHRRVGCPPPVLPGGPAGRRRGGRRRREGGRGRRRPGRPGRHARPQGRPGAHGPRPRPLAAPSAADRRHRRRPRGRRQLRVAHRAVRVRPGRARRAQGGPPPPAAPAGGEAGLLLLPDVEAPRRRRATGSRCPTTTARS